MVVEAGVLIHICYLFSIQTLAMGDNFGISGNDLRLADNIIIKKYTSNPDGKKIECHALQQLSDLRVPKIVKSDQPNEIHLAYIDGINGKIAINHGFVKEVLFEMGRFLRELQTVDITTVSQYVTGSGTVICHGDFAHYNSLMSSEGKTLLAIVDWEMCCIGDPIMDIAWCEFQFLRQFPGHKWALQYLFEGFGYTPAFDERQRSLQKRLEYLQPVSQEEAYYYFTPETMYEAAAFVAALTRFLHYPAGEAYCYGKSEPQIWWNPLTLTIALNEQCSTAVKKGFGDFPHTMKRNPDQESGFKKLFLENVLCPMGMDQAVELLTQHT